MNQSYGRDEYIDTFSDKRINPQLSIVLPCHNEEENIEKVVKDIFNELNGKIEFELIISEDGSKDNTKEIIRKLSKKYPIKAILSKNRKGYAGGIKDGVKLASAEYILIMDSDRQHDIKDFWKLWALKDYFDIISGWRIRRADSIFRKIMSKTFQFYAKILFHYPFHDATAPFKLMKKRVAKDIITKCKYMKESFWTEFVILAWLKKYSYAEIPVNHRKRKETRVYKPKKLLGIIVRQIIINRRIFNARK